MPHIRKEEPIEAEEEQMQQEAPSPLPRFILADTIAKSGSSVPSQPETAVHNAPVQVLVQEMETTLEGNLPSTIREILGKLKEKEENIFFDFCKTADSQVLMGTASLIEQARQVQQGDGKDKMFTIPGINLTVVLMAGKGDMLRAWDRKNNVGAIMYTQGQKTWKVLYLGYTPSGGLYHAEEKTLKYEDFSQADWKYVVNLGERILERKRKR
jgi:hypothetical protein